MEQMHYECHGHLMMEGTDYALSRAKHETAPNEAVVRCALSSLRDAGVGYFRDGGDPLFVSVLGRELSGEYGVEVVTPVYAIHKKGRYGSIVGRAWRDMAEYRALVEGVRAHGGDFIKIMASGIITFRTYGELSCPGLTLDELTEMVRIAHGEGFRVMTHVNGAETVRAAALAGVDSVEHGYFVDAAAMDAMVEHGVIWVPTLAAVEAFVGRDGFDNAVTESTLRRQQEALAAFVSMGGIVAAGSDSGAVGVPHGQGARREEALLGEAGITSEQFRAGSERVRRLFRYGEEGRA